MWALLRQIPYGETTTYRALAEAVARKRGLRQMSAQAVGGAVGHNPISIIVPCHRVVGSDGSLTGYAGVPTAMTATTDSVSGMERISRSLSDSRRVWT